MEPSRVTLEEAQELFQICMPGIKKEEKPAADCLGQILAKPVYAADKELYYESNPCLFACGHFAAHR